jgi:hypothetical protein
VIVNLDARPVALELHTFGMYLLVPTRSVRNPPGSLHTFAQPMSQSFATGTPRLEFESTAGASISVLHNVAWD